MKNLARNSRKEKAEKEKLDPEDITSGGENKISLKDLGIGRH